MLIRVDADSDTPLFAQVATSIRADIAAGRLVERDRLPAARAVAEALDINVHTVLRAYQDLRDEGLIELRRGRGAVVTAAAGAVALLRPDVQALVARAHDLDVSPEILAALVKEIAHEE